MDNQNDIPIAGANITINGTDQGTYSASDGSFVLIVRQPLPVKLTITYLGYELKEVTIVEASDNLLISLIPGALVGQEVVVSASRKREKVQEAPSAVDIIEEKALLIDGAINPFLSLRNKVGLDIVQTGINEGHITLRGRSAVFQTETFVIADYRNLVLPGLGAITYSQQPIDMIDLEKIEIVKGPGSALYGPGVEAGIIHFISKNPFDYQGTSISVGGGNRDYLQAAVRHAGVSSNQEWAYKFTGYYRKARDWELDPTDSVEASHLASFQPQIVSSLTEEVITDQIPDYNTESMGFTGTLAFQPSLNTTITAVGGWSVGKTIFRTTQGEGYTKAPRPFGQIRVQSGGFFGQAFWSYHGGSDGKSFLYPSGLTNITESHQLEGQLQYNFNPIKDRVHITVGGDYRLNTIDTKGTVHGRWENMDDYTILGGYSQVEVRLNKVLDFVAATRFDQFQALETSSLSPRLGLVYKPTPKHTIRATFNQAVGAPTSINLFADLPLANQDQFLVYLLGGADEVSFNQPTTSSLLPGMGPSIGIGMNLQEVYALLTSQLEKEGIIPNDIMNYLIDMKDQINGFSDGIPTQAPLSRSKLKLSKSFMYEIGYKGLIEDKLGISLDIYYNKRHNVISPPIQAGAFVLQPTLAADLSTAILDGLDMDKLQEIGLSPGAVANMYRGLADAVAFDGDTGQPNVLGILRPEQTPLAAALPTLDLAYFNIKEIDYVGIDFSAKYYFSSDIAAYTSISWLSEAYFEDVPVGDDETGPVTDFSLNIPDTKIKFGLEMYPEYGVNGFLMVRYQNAWNSNNGIPWTGPVDEFVVTDLGVGYTFRNDLRLNFTVTNLFEEDYRAIYGAPKIGRQLIGKVYYHF